jgi:hypothetical protein
MRFCGAGVRATGEIESTLWDPQFRDRLAALDH